MCAIIKIFLNRAIIKVGNCLRAIKRLERSQVPLLRTYLSSMLFRPFWQLTVANRAVKRLKCPQDREAR
jgi:hypothetical protein